MAELLVNTNAVCRNYSYYEGFGRVIPMLKANGYGMGAVPLMELLKKRQGAALVSCSRPEEALELAGHGVDVMLLSCQDGPEFLPDLVENQVILGVESLSQAKAVQALGVPARVQIAVDTGLGRFGFQPSRTGEMQALFDLEGISVYGIYSHLADSGQEEQLSRFRQVLSELQEYPVGLRHIASTHSAVREGFRMDAARIGSGLTGLVHGLTPAAVLTGRIVSLRQMKKGTAVSYSGVKLKRDTDMAIIDVGTADGAFTYRGSGPRTWLASKRQSVTVNGAEAPLLGYPGLTHTAIDVTGISCRAGERVTVHQSPVMVSGSVPRVYVEE